ncbi:hypothetical protein ACFZBU_17635 [Embleya sp. NPDC008237]|uniref:hypothetical protein n=1 Tax=Embleya sp. NPDC008237 TaxID=3363978 RepID=UPI0036EAE01B
MSNHVPPKDESPTVADTRISPEQRAALERLTSAGDRAGAWLCAHGRPGGPAWALAGAIEHVLRSLHVADPAGAADRTTRPGVDADLLRYLDPYASPAGPVLGAVPLTAAETVAVLTAAGCARIAPQAMSRADWAEYLRVLADAIDDALDHAAHPPTAHRPHRNTGTR